MKQKNTAIDFLKNLDLIIAGLALVVLIAITFFGVVMRYFFSNPFVWQEEVQLMCFIWIIFFGAGAAFRTGSHVAIEIVVDLLPRKVAKVVESFGYLVVMGVLGYLLFQSMVLIGQLANSGRVTNILAIPNAFIYSAIPIGCVLMIVNYSIMEYKKWAHAEQEEGVE